MKSENSYDIDSLVNFDGYIYDYDGADISLEDEPGDPISPTSI